MFKVLGIMTSLLITSQSKERPFVLEDILVRVRVRERKIVRPKQSYSENQTRAKESDNSNNTSNVGATTWVKEDKTPKLGPFTGNRGAKQISSDITKVLEIIELFLGDNFFEMLCKETNLYYFQNKGKCGSSSKGLKWVDVSVAEMKKFFEIIILMG
jgi:hypothetical protein